jgi:hypothetical protein
MASIKLRWVVENLSNVMLVYDVMKVYRSTAGIGGPYSEITIPATRVPLVADVTLYEFIDTAGDTSYWYKFSYFDSVGLGESALSDPIAGTDEGGLYCSVQDLRDEGITVAMLSDDRALAKIAKWSRAIERWTGRWFEPRVHAYTLDGEGGSVQRCPIPIIRLDTVATVSGRGAGYLEESISVDEIRVYNRHLTQGLIRPDDRANPRVEAPRVDSAFGPEYRTEPGVFYSDLWKFPRGRLNIKLSGVFGYTELIPGDPVGETSAGSQVPLSFGSTPPLIKELCMLLVARDYPQIADTSLREDLRARWRVEQEKTRDQMVKLTSLKDAGQLGAWTGDPELDGIIAMYVAPSASGFFAEAV